MDCSLDLVSHGPLVSLPKNGTDQAPYSTRDKLGLVREEQNVADSEQSHRPERQRCEQGDEAHHDLEALMQSSMGQEKTRNPSRSQTEARPADTSGL